MIGASQFVGFALFSLAVVWFFLFVNPKSPVRRIWWSTSKLGITLADSSEFGININEEEFTIRVGLFAVPAIRVDKISLKIGQTRVWASNWKPMDIKAIEAPFIKFPKPHQLGKGQYYANLKAHTPEGFSKSEKFLIKVDSG
ncbi:hypothetical protein ACFLXJ_02995 [Chloroflexota bacterium]